MSRGLGRVQKGIVLLLALSAEHRLSRAQIEEALVEHQGFSKKGVLRAIRSLERARFLKFKDAPDKNEAILEVLHAEPVPNQRVLALLREARSRQAEPAEVSRGHAKGTANPDSVSK